LQILILTRQYEGRRQLTHLLHFLFFAFSFQFELGALTFQLVHVPADLVHVFFNLFLDRLALNHIDLCTHNSHHIVKRSMRRPY